MFSRWASVSSWRAPAFAVAVLISVGLNLFVVQVTEVRQRSMENTLFSSDRVLVSKVDYRVHAPTPGDIIVFKPPIETNIPYVKRVIGLPGDVIDLRDGRVVVNGRELNEPYAIGLTTPLKMRTTRCSITSWPNGSHALGRPMRLLWPPHNTMPPTVVMGISRRYGVIHAPRLRVMVQRLSRYRPPPV